MSQIKHSKKIILNTLYLFLAAVLILFAFYGFHDSQIAQGAGLFFTLQYNMEDRTFFDNIIDILGFVAILLSALLPLLLLKKFTPAAFLRFVCLFLSLVPMINPGSLVHIGAHFSDWSFRGNLTFYNIIDTLRPIIPIFIIILFFAIIKGVNTYDNSNVLNISVKILFILSALCFILYFLFPGFSEYTLYLAYYFTLIAFFNESENLIQKKEKPLWILWLFYLICGLKGIYRIITLLQAMHI